MASGEIVNGIEPTRILIPGPHKGYFVNGEQALLPREEIADLWKNAHAVFFDYEEGHTNGGIYYPSGKRLIIGGKEIYNAQGKIVGALEGEHVMDSCEIPWARETAKQMFKKIEELSNPSEEIKLLVIGTGPNFVTEFLLRHLVAKGKGRIDMIELNAEVAKSTRDWIKQKKSQLNSFSRPYPQAKPIIEMELIEGDAFSVLKKWAEEGKRRYTGIVSDTYPFTPEEIGKNDLNILEFIVQILDQEGVYSPCLFTPNRNGSLFSEQINDIYEFFDGLELNKAFVTAVPGYDFLKKELEKGHEIVEYPVSTAYKPKKATN